MWQAHPTFQPVASMTSEMAQGKIKTRPRQDQGKVKTASRQHQDSIKAIPRLQHINQATSMSPIPFFPLLLEVFNGSIKYKI